MRIDISLLPALAAAFMLVSPRIGAMVMLFAGVGETNIPVPHQARDCPFA